MFPTHISLLLFNVTIYLCICVLAWLLALLLKLIKYITKKLKFSLALENLFFVLQNAFTNTQNKENIFWQMFEIPKKKTNKLFVCSIRKKNKEVWLKKGEFNGGMFLLYFSFQCCSLCHKKNFFF